MHDFLVRAVAANGTLRIHGTVTTNLCNEAQKRHHTWPVASAALGRLLTGTLMMGGMLLKGDQKIMVHIKGDGPLEELMAVADAAGHVKGYVGQPQVHLPLNQQGKLDVSGGIGSGQLFVTRNTGLKEPYRGAVPLVSGEIGDDIAYYFAKSEQIPSVVSLGVLVETDYSIRAAGGIIVQVMPGADEALICAVEKEVTQFSNISRKIDTGYLPDAIIMDAFSNMDVQIIERIPVEFRCECSKERFERGLISLGKNQLEELLAEQEDAETVCQFCGTKYRFEREDLLRILAEARATDRWKAD